MTKMLEQAVEKVRELPEADQDVAADILFGLAAKRSDADDLDEETIAAINEGLAQIERGEIATDEEMDELFRRFDA